MLTYESDVRTKYEAWCTCGWTETHAKEYQAEHAARWHAEHHKRHAPEPTTKGH